MPRLRDLDARNSSRGFGPSRQFILPFLVFDLRRILTILDSFKNLAGFTCTGDHAIGSKPADDVVESGFQHLGIHLCREEGLREESAHSITIIDSSCRYHGEQMSE